MNIPLKYSHNWNNKLHSPIHTTIRLWNEKKYFKGAKFQEMLKDEILGNVCVVEVRRMRLIQINDFIAGLDTGYLAAPCHEMIKTMYKNKVKDWNTQDLAFILLRKID